MPINPADQSNITPSSGENLSPPHGVVEKAIRSLGFKKVTPYYPDQEWILKTASIGNDDKNLSDRTAKEATPDDKDTHPTSTRSTDNQAKEIDEYTLIETVTTKKPLFLINILKNNYLGFYPTDNHLKILEDNLYNLRLGQLQNEPDNEFKTRIQKAVSDGIKNNKKRMDHNYFNSLKQALETPIYLAENSKTQTFNNHEQALDWFNACRNYLIKGEGKQLLEDLGTKNTAQLDQYFPELELDQLGDNYLSSLSAFQRLSTNTKPTNISALKDASTAHGFTLLDTDEIIEFSTTDRTHRCLVILDNLETFYHALKHCTSITRMDDKITDAEYGKIQNLVDNTKSNFDVLTHRIMIQKLPKQFGPQDSKPYAYQYTVLKDHDGLIRWESDTRQFRGGRRDKDSEGNDARLKIPNDPD
ncbi:MAG: hypothetical protein PUP46_01065 [Endozoicomonas sp. (ex Botrylloides leachii)]|nr:hypothetical protein [Endozoicomonas sp. (ex Botrylloides leachii)]